MSRTVAEILELLRAKGVDPRCSTLYTNLSAASRRIEEAQTAHADLVRLLVGPDVNAGDPSAIRRAIMVKHGASRALIEALAQEDLDKASELFTAADTKAAADDFSRIIESERRGLGALHDVEGLMAEAQQVLDANPPTGGST